MQNESVRTPLTRAAPGTIERSNEDEYLIVEIGSGQRPYILDAPAAYRQQFRDTPQARIVGVDIDEEELRAGVERVREQPDLRELVDAGRIRFEKTTVGKLRFADNSVSQVVVRDVMGDENILPSKKGAILAEAVRVLRPSGILKIIERQAPAYARELGILNLHTIFPHLEPLGPEEQASVLDEREMDNSMLVPGDLVRHAAFIIQYRKKESLDKAGAGV